MQSLSDLIKERSEEMDVQIVKAKTMTENDKDWQDIRHYIDDLPNNYIDLLKEKIANDPLSIKKRKIVGGNAIEVILKTQQIKNGYRLAYEIELYILEKYPEKEITKAWYIAWNNIKGTCYKKDLLNPQLENV